MYSIYNIQYLYKDQYGKHIFSVPKETPKIEELYLKIEKYQSINPIYRKDNESNWLIKFNDSEHNFKPNNNYDIHYCIHKSYSEKTTKNYINLHIKKAHRKNKRELDFLSIEEL